MSGELNSLHEVARYIEGDGIFTYAEALECGLRVGLDMIGPIPRFRGLDPNVWANRTYKMLIWRFCETPELRKRFLILPSNTQAANDG